MEAFRIMTVVQTVAFIQGYDKIISTEHPKVKVNMKFVSQADRHSGSCSWTLSTSRNNTSVIAVEDINSLSSQICLSLGCDDVYKLKAFDAEFNSTCLTGCLYHDSELNNCTQTVRSHCKMLSEVICGNAAVRLVGGGHRCGGRVEVWRGSWGTVCDDKWDVEDANVVCSQLGCGYAVSVSGQGEPYGQGTGPIHLDELNCTGIERSLWECPALTQGHDCGHKEDAGVVCSEYKALRLTGGLDRCAGRVEIHRNGRWGTVCDTCWHKEEATMACDMLNCGMVKHFTAFDPPLKHKNESLWYFICNQNSKNLWECPDYIDNEYLCKETNAAGLICNNSLGLSVPTSQIPTSAPATIEITKKDNSHRFLPSPELLGCFVLGFFLVIAVITNILLCHHDKKKKAVVVQKRYMNLQATAEAEENNYRDSIHLVNFTNNISDPEVPVFPQHIWPQSSVESDTDYEQHDISLEAAFPFSTFHTVPAEVSVKGYQQICDTSSNHGAHQMRESATSVDSFKSSCTSSGECYENTGTNAQEFCSLESAEFYENTGENRDSLQTADLPKQESGKSLLGHTMDPPFNYQDKGGSGREDSPLYSPITYNNESISPESDYDDIGNYIQQPNYLN
ncbi:T-cell differentiation antigen CD6-like isoform X2 [Pimephales promelas]|uniref:T-cell differentiation antigen CD6-like isoform X2 n=1 Tax=Pimephales promelas TaxID=90988 RepID=UPI001955CF99|nr:T-cell differentiation antigen CD6-like isoform X2 [Pimephales promelas]